MRKIKSLDDGDAKLLYHAGQAIVGIDTYLHPSPSTQPVDIVEDAQKVILNNGPYSREKIDSYIKVLKKYNLHEDELLLRKKHMRLIEIARLG